MNFCYILVRWNLKTVWLSTMPSELERTWGHVLHYTLLEAKGISRSLPTAAGVYENSRKCKYHNQEMTDLRILYQNRKYVKPFPRWVLILIYLAVPVRLLCSLYGICLLVSGSMYSLANPKSIMCIIWFRLVECLPIRKFSGLTSRYIRLLLCTNSTRSN